MAANADDLRRYYAEHIGPSVVHGATTSGTKLAAALQPGRYLLRTMDVSSATKLWLVQGDHDEALDGAVATAAPSTPIDLAEDPRPSFTFMVRPKPSGTNATGKASNSFGFITDAGTVNVVITRINSGG